MYQISGLEDTYISDGLHRRRISPAEKAEIDNVAPALDLHSGGLVLQLAHHIGAQIQHDIVMYRVSTAPTEDERNEIWATNGINRWHIPDDATLQTMRILNAAGIIDLAADGTVRDLPRHIGAPAGAPVAVSGQDLATALAPQLPTVVANDLTTPATQHVVTIAELFSAVQQLQQQQDATAALAAACQDLAAAVVEMNENRRQIQQAAEAIGRPYLEMRRSSVDVPNARDAIVTPGQTAAGCRQAAD